MKILKIIISIFAILIIGLGIYFYFNQASKITAQKNNIESLKQETSQSLEKIDHLTSEVKYITNKYDENNKTLGMIQQERDSLATENESLQSELTDLKNENDQLKNKVDQSNKEVARLTQEKTSLNDKLMCDNPITSVTFTDNKSVNNALVSYVNKTKGIDEPVTAHYWNIIWSDSKYSTHTIEVNSKKDQIVYVWKFTVYFNGESYGHHKNGIFYNDNQCWLYLSK